MDAFKGKTITSQTILMIIFSGSTSALTLIVYSLAARNLPVHDVAEGILIATFAWYSTSLIDFGGSTYAVREIMGERISLAEARYFSVLKASTLIPCLIFGLVFFHSQSGIVIRLFILTFILLATNVLTIEFRVIGFTSALSIISFTEKISLLFFLFVAILMHSSIHFVDLILISNVLAFFVALFLSDKSNAAFKRANFRSLFIGSLGIGTSSSVTQIQIMDVNLLALKIGTMAASPYVLVTRWTNALGIFSNIFSQAIAPIVAKKELTRKEIIEIARNSYLLVLSLLICILVAFQASNLVNIFLGKDFYNSGKIVSILAVATIFSTIAQPLSTILQNRRNPWKVTIALFFGISIQFLFIFLFASEVGALAAAYGFLLGQFVTASLLIFFTSSLIKNFLDFLFNLVLD